MFPNVNAELGRKRMSIRELSTGADIQYDSLRNKLNGRTEFTRSEMFRIKHFLAPDLPLDILFAEPDKTACKSIRTCMFH